jgi:hypothetical protein
MVLPLLDLVPELQALFALLLADWTTAGRLSQASHACKQLLQQRLVQLREERRLAIQAQMEAMRQQKRAVLLELFEAIDGGLSYRCKAHMLAFGTPCGRQLRVPRSGSLQVLMSHLQHYHSADTARSCCSSSRCEWHVLWR